MTVPDTCQDHMYAVHRRQSLKKRYVELEEVLIYWYIVCEGRDEIELYDIYSQRRPR